MPTNQERRRSVMSDVDDELRREIAQVQGSLMLHSLRSEPAPVELTERLARLETAVLRGGDRQDNDES
jgi:hypothetical protein